MPQNDLNKLSGIQFYFYDPEHQVSNRLKTLPRLDITIVERLVKLMEPNPYSEFLKHVSSLNNIEEYHIVIRSDPGLDQRIYNRPTSTEVTGIWIKDESGETNDTKLWDIRVYTKSDKSHRVQYYYDSYDPLQYLLMFPNGEPGWHCSIPRASSKLNRKKSGFNGPGIDFSQTDGDETPSTNDKRRKQRSVSCKEYYMYKLQERPNDISYSLRFGRLFQQYIVDNYIKIESMRLDFLRNNQKKTRQEQYQGVVDSVISGVVIAWKVGKRVYLSSTFIGGPRDLRNRYLDFNGGLPHAHFLIILKPTFKYMSPEAYDCVVCPELPDQKKDPYLYIFVCKTHDARSMRRIECRQCTYPVYRRKNDGKVAKVRGRTLDNHWVIPYNPTLLAQFNCHINVEICCDITDVKYLYKYVHKGHDKFEEGVDLKEILQDNRLKRTMLTKLFATNVIDDDAKRLNLLYKEFPQHYVWDGQLRTWTKIKRGAVICRLCIVTPVENERYYLRVLLNNVRCPTSFDHLLTLNGVLLNSFQEAAYKRDFLHNDADIERTMEEASIYRMPVELRRLFATLLHYCRPSDPQLLFKKYYDYMEEDFKRLQNQLMLSEQNILHKVLQGINDTLESLGRKIYYHKQSTKALGQTIVVS
ncbi:hypothetical protein LIER_15712 [Lithospermum erythrorhizon]|uniref:Helitron helicase-like domain-containing protein n=1 Tax=Lithospermum erythrorhizon TaxID=34254 RepID=A0AAV3Q4W2_LITER